MTKDLEPLKKQILDELADCNVAEALAWLDETVKEVKREMQEHAFYAPGSTCE